MQNLQTHAHHVKKELRIGTGREDLFQNRQLSLFQNFLCNTEEERQKLSNTIELWESVPRYSISRQAMNILRDKHGNLPLLKHEFKYGGIEYCATIQAAQVEEESAGNGIKTISYYPSSNEELIEEVLRKFAVEQAHGFYEKAKFKSGVAFSLYQLREELKRRGHTRSYDEIVLSLNILSGSTIQLVANTLRSRAFTKSSYFPMMAAVTRRDRAADPTSKWLVHFHPLVTECIDKVTFRQFNYHRLMSHTTQLARWLHKQLIMKYTYASMTKSFEMHFKTIKRDSRMLENYSRSRAAQDACEFSFNELKSNGVLRNFSLKKEVGERGKITDIVYTLYASQEFVSEVKASNKRCADLSTAMKYREV